MCDDVARTSILVFSNLAFAAPLVGACIRLRGARRYAVMLSTGFVLLASMASHSCNEGWPCVWGDGVARSAEAASRYVDFLSVRLALALMVCILGLRHERDAKVLAAALFPASIAGISALTCPGKWWCYGVVVIAAMISVWLFARDTGSRRRYEKAPLVKSVVWWCAIAAFGLGFGAHELSGTYDDCAPLETAFHTVWHVLAAIAWTFSIYSA